MKIYLKESEIKTIVKQVLKEELGSFNDQYQIAKYIIKKAKEMYAQNIYSANIKIENSNDISSVDLNIVEGYMLSQIIDFNPETKKLNIEIGSLNLNKENLPNIIAHELMHGHIYLKRMHYNPSFNVEEDVPDYYEDVLSIIQMHRCDIAYYFCYALYSTFYQETNEFVSQTSGDIIDNVKTPITKKEFKEYYAKTNSVQTFHSNIKYAKYILNLGDKAIQNYIINKINILKFNDVKTIKKECLKIIKISENALKDCARNSMIAFEYLTKNNLILDIN